ncbi:FecR domain-containing protein [Corallococcus macrosporus]|uniref:FecR domain-containing protein n=1 Tax=Corallococcus macrosporus TaxID=35 RepID=A0ABS3DN59_9BACT|nr:FecR domain-containing protein [Corallococcus macrosporus]MBN8232765.1 FecR domain-containing protein [Corallococcus macrosporus]
MAAPSSRKRQVPFLVGLVLILAALPVGWFVFLRETPAPLPPAAPPRAVVAAAEAKKVVELVLSQFDGNVEVRHGEGAWEPARKDMPLRPTDVVRTGRGSWAVVLNGESVELRMESDTEISVEQLSNELSKVLLSSGLATATVRGRPNVRHTFILKAKNGDAEASTSQGTFTMSNNGKGTVSVGTREGDVKLTGKEGKFVIVRAGQRSIVRPGQAPTEPAPIPSTVFVKMDWPKAKKQREAKLVVTGHTEPGTRVMMNGAVVATDADGGFTLDLDLKEGGNPVRVTAVGVGGTPQEEKRELILDTKPPIEVDAGTLW